ncbi:MAG TPA: hypothetical protein IAA93_06790 [Candidatus Avibacteroides avistercoris]|uniref:Uncharacterized protein n=1 Tax=Candidatus Avibacteroides avistercoris TaxID=2840690 RepID=A0A9D2UJ57_9BACT|nr:hypothetical protein [Candidatus Avibacteroides avistercoris]
MRLRRRDIIPLLLFAYVTLMAALSLPGNDAIPTADKVIVVIISYTFVALLYFVLRRIRR